MGDLSRSMALPFIIVFFIATFIGSLLPESGNIIARYFKLPAHTFNVVFLIVGIIGVGVACYLGYKNS